jgi:predicted ATPase
VCCQKDTIPYHSTLLNFITVRIQIEIEIIHTVMTANQGSLRNNNQDERSMEKAPSLEAVHVEEPVVEGGEEEIQRMSPPSSQQQQQQQDQESMAAREYGPQFLQMKTTETPLLQQQSLQHPLLAASSVPAATSKLQQQLQAPSVLVDTIAVKSHDANEWYSSWKKNLQELIYERPAEEAILEKVFAIEESNNHEANRSISAMNGCHISNSPRNSSNNINNHKHFTLIKGPRGSGKTRLVRSVWKKTQANAAFSGGGGGGKGGGYLITGKFDSSHQLLAPYQAYLSAITEFCHLLWQQGGPAVVQTVGAAVHQALGNEVSVLTSMIPALTRILDAAAAATGTPSCATTKSLCNKETEQGHQCSSTGHDSGSGTCSSSATKRFACAFQVLLRVLARSLSHQQQPFVLLLDDLQYADQCSLDLLVLIVTDSRNCNSGLLVVGTHDVDDDASSPSDSSYLAAKLLEIQDFRNVAMVNICLKNLEKEQVEQVLSDALDLDDASTCDRLATMVYDKTRGNQFYTYAYLCRLVEQGRLVRNQVTGSWTWNDEQYSTMRNSLPACNIHAFLNEQWRNYPVELMDVLKVSACFGARIQEQLVSFVLGYPVDKQLKQAEKRGIIFYDKEYDGYVFVHDLVQDAIDELTPDEDRELFHLEVGRRLWRRLGSVQLDRNIYIVLSQVAIATLCLHAGNKAAESSSFRIACVYLTFGIDLLTGVSWRDQYDLLLTLHNSAAEMLMYSANFERMNEVVDNVIRHARVYEDKIQAYSTRIWALGVTDRQHECSDLGVEVLKHLGVHFPRCLCRAQAYAEWKKVRKLLRGKINEQLLRLPPLQDKRIAQILRILQFIQLHVLVAKPKFVPFVWLKSIKLTLENGISVLAPLAFCSYAALCVTFNRPEEAFRFADLALIMLNRMEVIEYLPRVYVSIYGYIYGYKKDLRASLEPLLTAQCVGHQTGDLEYASVAASMYFVNALESGHSLQVILKEALRYRSRMISSGQKTILRITEPHLEFIRRLTASPGEAFDFDKAVKEATQLGTMKRESGRVIVWRRDVARCFIPFYENDSLHRLLTLLSFACACIGSHPVPSPMAHAIGVLIR